MKEDIVRQIGVSAVCFVVGFFGSRGCRLYREHRELLESVRTELQASSDRRQYQLPLWFNTITNIDGSLNVVFINGSLSDVQIGTLTRSNSFLLVSNKLHMIAR